jgi:hypothetical protein
LMSAPDKSSFAMTYSSKSTSLAKLMREVCNLDKRSIKAVSIIRRDKPEYVTFCLDVRKWELDLPIDAPGPN